MNNFYTMSILTTSGSNTSFLLSILIFAGIILVFIGVCIIEAYLALNKKLIHAIIIPIIALVLPRVFSMITGTFTVSMLFPSLAAVIIIAVFAVCRLFVKKKQLDKLKRSVKTMEVEDI